MSVWLWLLIFAVLLFYVCLAALVDEFLGHWQELEEAAKKRER